MAKSGFETSTSSSVSSSPPTESSSVDPILSSPREPETQALLLVAPTVPCVDLPVGHGVHLDASPVLKVSAGQRSHSVLFPGVDEEKVPAGHPWHGIPSVEQTTQLVKPVPAVLWPSGHSEHWTAPKTSGSHSVDPAFAAKKPAWQGLQDMLPFCDAKRPASHSVHCVEPSALENVPAWHGEHSLLPVLDETLPGWQGMHSGDPITAAKDPGSQREQVAMPVSAAYVPTSQASQLADPGSAVARPAAQSVHEERPGSGADVPASQRAQEAAPSALLCLPRGHAWQLVEPATSAKVPAWHERHELMFAYGASVPGGQSEHSLEPSGAADPGGHSVHSWFPLPSATEPPAQGEHAASPCVGENDPLGHVGESTLRAFSTRDQARLVGEVAGLARRAAGGALRGASRTQRARHACATAAVRVRSSGAGLVAALRAAGRAKEASRTLPAFCGAELVREASRTAVLALGGADAAAKASWRARDALRRAGVVKIGTRRARNTLCETVEGRDGASGALRAGKATWKRRRSAQRTAGALAASRLVGEPSRRTLVALCRPRLRRNGTSRACAARALARSIRERSDAAKAAVDGGFDAAELAWRTCAAAVSSRIGLVVANRALFALGRCGALGKVSGGTEIAGLAPGARRM
eukprot:scaffold770_cov255-Pinguiococcus_pyrenoidosus.AAC.76